jgi:hypothetical protein
MQVVFGLTRLGSSVGLPLFRSVQVFLIASEVALLLAADRLLELFQVSKRRWLLLFGIAWNPICILLVCQHGNFDVLVALSILLFWIWLFRFHRDGEWPTWQMAALWLGLGVTLKTAPAILSPILCAGARRLPATARAIGAVLVFGPALYGLSILLALGPSQISHHVFAYRSVSGWFGVTGVFHLLRRDDWIGPYAIVFSTALGIAATLLAARLWRAAHPTSRELLLWSILLLMSIPFLGSGYGPQYLYWFWPLLIVAAATGGRALQWSTGLFAAVACATYSGEYAVMESLGAFLVWKSSSPGLAFLSIALRSNRAAALAHAPLFLAYALLFAALLREVLRSPREIEPAG